MQPQSARSCSSAPRARARGAPSPRAPARTSAQAAAAEGDAHARVTQRKASVRSGLSVREQSKCRLDKQTLPANAARTLATYTRSVRISLGDAEEMTALAKAAAEGSSMSPSKADTKMLCETA
eukprot:1565723-Pleurochrysis_carterae.AAC.1